MKTLAASQSIKVADEAWVALALLHRTNPDRTAFSSREIFEKVRAEALHSEVRAGVQPHISLHNVANVPANSARYRMFFRTEDGRYRLFRPGDACHASRSGKIRPERDDLPEQYHELLDWYDAVYSTEPQSAGGSMEKDPFLRMRGVGKEIWIGIDADDYVEGLRSGWEMMDSPAANDAQEHPGSAASEFANEVWDRLLRHQGEDFKTKRGLLFRYEVEGSGGIWFYREGKRIEQRLSRTELEKALRELPLSGPADIKDLRDPSYVYGLLVDPRIISEP